MSTKKYRIRLTTDEQQELNAVSRGRAARGCLAYVGDYVTSHLTLCQGIGRSVRYNQT